jgi:hypothetical protein
MRVAYAAVLLSLLTTGCAHLERTAPSSEPPVDAAQPGTSKPPAKPNSPAPPKPAPAAALPKAPTPSAGTPAPEAASKAAPPAAPAPAVAPALDLNSLGAQLKETKAIGIFTKITLKNQVDDLLDQFREFYNGKATFTMGDLRRSFDLLMMKVLTLLQDADQRLASAIVSSRESIWGLLADSETFATVQG